MLGPKARCPLTNILIEADVYTPATPRPESVNLYNNIKRLQLDVAQILPIHGRQVTLDDLRAAIGRTGN